MFHFQGRVFFDVNISRLREVLELRCIDHVWVIIGVWPCVDLDLKEASQANLFYLIEVFMLSCN